MKKYLILTSIAVLLTVAVVVFTQNFRRLRGELSGYQEVPSVSTVADGISGQRSAVTKIRSHGRKLFRPRRHGPTIPYPFRTEKRKWLDRGLVMLQSCQSADSRRRPAVPGSSGDDIGNDNCCQCSRTSCGAAGRPGNSTGRIRRAN